MDNESKEIELEFNEAKEIELEYLGGSSRFEEKYLKIENGSQTNGLKIEGNEFMLKTFEWHEQETRNSLMAAIGFLLGFLLGIAVENPFLGLVLGLVGARILGWSHDRSKIILTLLDGENQIIVYARCNRQDFKELSRLL